MQLLEENMKAGHLKSTLDVLKRVAMVYACLATVSWALAEPLEGSASSDSPAFDEATTVKVRGPRLEFFLNLGAAKQTGYLTTDKSETATQFGFHFLAPRGLFAFEFGSFQANHDTGEFQLGNNQSVRVSTFSWMSYIDVLSKGRFGASLGIGPAIVTLAQSSPDYRIDFGAFVFGGLLRYQLNDNWSLQFKSQWYGIEQVANAQTTGFEVWQNTLGVGYSWN
jgi:hypothetical protein